MDSLTLDQLDATVRGKMQWTTTGIYLKLHATHECTILHDVDICDTIGKKDTVSKTVQRQARWWFPSSIQTQEQCLHIIKNACAKAGFTAASRTSGSVRVDSFATTIICSRGTVSNPSANNNRKYRTHTKRPHSKEESCKFCFFFHQSTEPQTAGRYFIYRYGAGCKDHHNHCHLLPQHVRVSIDTIPKDEIERAMDALRMNINVRSIQAMISKQVGLNLNVNQIRSLRKQLLDVSVLEPGTPAERLLSMVESNDNIIYRVYTGSIDDQDRITLYAPRKKSVTKQKTTFPSSPSNNRSLGCDFKSANNQHDLGETPEMTDHRVIKNLGLKSGQSILLCLFWITKKQYRYFELFPTVLGTTQNSGTAILSCSQQCCFLM